MMLKPELNSALVKADRFMQTARLAFADGDPESAVSRAYYGLFHVTAVLLEVVANRTRERWEHTQLEKAFLDEFASRGFRFSARDGNTWKEAHLSRVNADYRVDELRARAAQRLLSRIEDLVARMKDEIQRSA